jgi:hypothetical protein
MPSSTPLPSAPPPAPEARAGCGTFFLILAAGLGTIICSALAVYTLFFNSEELPDQGPWDTYDAVSLLWAAAAGIAALVTAFAPPVRGRTAAARRIALLDTVMALAIFWPLEAAAFALYVATRRALRPGIRLAAPAIGIVALIGGGWWATTSYHDSRLTSDTHVSYDALLGQWRTSDGGLLELDGNGRFSATQVPKQLFTDDWESEARIDATGGWTLGADGDVDINYTDVGIEGGTTGYLSVYRTRSARMLCIVEDPDTACGPGLTFLRVPGPAAAAR